MGEAKRRKAPGAVGTGWRLVPVHRPKPLRSLTIPATAERVVTPEMLHFLAALAEEIRVLARAQLAAIPAPGTRAALDAAVAVIGLESDRLLERQIAGHRAKIAGFAADLDAAQCRAGCAHCCHFNVDVTMLEVLRIDAAMSVGAVANRRAEIAGTAPRIAGLTRAARRRLGISCPLLIDGACSAYAARPLACRSLLSLGAAACAADFAAGLAGEQRVAVPSLALPMLLGTAIFSGQVAALGDFRLPNHAVELTAALDLLEREPGALDRWLAGEDVFPRAA
jgi:hypothetical protein